MDATDSLESPPTLLDEVPIFKLLNYEERASLSAMLEAIRVPRGRVLFNFGDPGDSLYLVRSGRVELFSHDHGGDKIVLMVCGPGNFFGELSLLDNGPRTATALALDDCELLQLRRDELLDFLRSRPDVAVDMLIVMGQRIRTTGELLRQRVTRNANEEVADRRTFAEKLADSIAQVCGSIYFLALHLALFALWISWNIEIAYDTGRNWLGFNVFDPFPFGLLAMSVSVEAIILSTCLLISQNRQAAKDRIRADIEYDVNLKAELEVAHLHSKVDRMHAEILARLHEQNRA